jgi:hypothetical protein
MIKTAESAENILATDPPQVLDNPVNEIYRGVVRVHTYGKSLLWWYWDCKVCGAKMHYLSLDAMLKMSIYHRELHYKYMKSKSTLDLIDEYKKKADKDE